MPVTSFLTGPHRTPKSVKFLIILTAVLSFVSPIVTFILQRYFQIAGPQQWLSLSLWGIKQGWFWQPFTYFFIHSVGLGISLSLLFSLFFHMFLLWFSGSEIANRYGAKTFILFYLSAGLVAGLISLICLLVFSSQSVVVGSGPPVYALLMAWAMLYPELEIYFFFFIKVKAKWLVAIFLGLALLISLSYGQFLPFIADLVGIAWGFTIGRLVWHLPNPYPLNLDFSKMHRSRENKIIDINVFQESDDAFMDRMLEKIATKGEKSLTRRERERMRKISESKK
ncbi:MAG: rhomboid family intramembrane serine protease [Chlamydiales bacterium]